MKSSGRDGVQQRSSLFERLFGIPVVIVSGLVLFVFAAAGALSPVPALLGFAAILAAAIIGGFSGSANREVGEVFTPQSSDPGDNLIIALIAALPDPALALDRDGRVLAFNPGAGALAPAMRRGEPVSLALRIPDLNDAIRKAAATGETQRVEFSERVPVDRWYEAHVAPLNRNGRANGRPDLMLVIVHDLTPLHRVEQMRADFIANASHELRTPLAALTGFIETLEGPARDDPEARERFLAIMKQQARRMARLIDDLLSLSRIEQREHLRPETPVDLVSVVRQVLDALQTLARDRGVEIETVVAGEVLIVPGDRDELERVFDNLVENALKYGAAGKRVEIRLGRDAGPDGRPEAVVSVRDYGPGIAPEHLPRLTERFYRVDVGVSRAEGGTGLGLALVKHILNRHHGRLIIESKLGEGATFTVRLPLIEKRA
jgi:two-component system phosphate regulon sensor histidine kinase PhoR